MWARLCVGLCVFSLGACELSKAPTTAEAPLGSTLAAAKPSSNCGNGVIDSGETCDPPGTCPQQCEPAADACVSVTKVGNHKKCTAACVETPITACNGGDGCCPDGCDGQDSDCGGEPPPTSDDPVCGNGVVEEGETCDPRGSCPKFCPQGDACTSYVKQGSKKSCNVECVAVPVSACAGGDGCCPDGCTNANDSDCSSECGNGVVEAGETCDGDCPTTCDDGDACTTDTLVGGAATCDARCEVAPVGSCSGGDGCCPSGCDSTQDADCAPVCGNGVVEAGELCDGDCPTSCDDGDVCTADSLIGSAATCSARCEQVSVTVCGGADGCCPAGCTANDDGDCSPTCGNGVLEAGETCDGDCPVSCDDGDVCTNDSLLGAAASCSARCEIVPVSVCGDGDGCCPDGCNSLEDGDCATVCGNGLVEADEACDGDCPTSCDDGDACTTDTLSGSAATCDAACGHAAVTICTGGDGCCPDGCSDTDDGDCVALSPCDASPGSTACCAEAPEHVSCVSVDLVVTSADAYEHEGIVAVFELRLDEAATDDIEIELSFGGNAHPARGSASAADYQLRHAGQIVTSPILVPAGTTAHVVTVTAVDDATPEVPETLSLTVNTAGPVVAGAAASGTLRLMDAVPDVSNRRLFYAPLRPEPGVTTVASGIVTVQLEGDNDAGLIALNWSGLTSTQTAAHVHIKNPVTGPPIESLPLGMFDDHVWEIRAAQFLTTDQMVLDALLDGALYVNVHSTDYPAGEIRGDVYPIDGSTTFTPPPDPSPVAALTGDDLRHDLVRFLNQATFGATPSSLANLEARVQANGGDRIAAMSAWIDEQMDPVLTPSASLYAFTEASRKLYGRTVESTGRDKRSAWWTFARYGVDQLRQRVGFALSEILVVSDANNDVSNYSVGAADYQDRLNAGAFGPYEAILGQVSRHPIMGTYLSHLKNRRTIYDSEGNVTSSPDENYAREIMQLFSIGLVNLHPDGSLLLTESGLPRPTYDNDVIKEVAKVFTGLSFGAYQDVEDGPVVANDNFWLGGGYYSPRYRWRTLMKMFDDQHEGGSKTIFDGIVIPPSDGETEIDLLHDALMAHPSTAPFISRRLIQRLVTSNPSPGYIYRVSTAFADGGADLGAAVRAILLDPEARDISRRFERGFGKQKEPAIRFLHMLRLTDSFTNMPLDLLTDHAYPSEERAKLPPETAITRMNWHTNGNDHFGQRPLGARSVFNFFTPDYAPPGPIAQLSLVAPEFQITNEYQLYQTTNLVYWYLYWGSLYGDSVPEGYPDDAEDLRRDLSSYITLHDDELAANGAVSAATTLVDHLDLYLNGGYLKARFAGVSTPNPRTMMIDGLAAMNDWARVQEALYIMHANSYSQIQR